MGDLTDNSEAAAGGVVVARRPVVDRDRRIVGFELVYHPHALGEGFYPGSDTGVVAVYELLRNHDFSLDEVVGDKLAFCHVDLDVLVGDSPLMLSPRRTVLQVRGTTADPELLDGCAARRREGYTVALDAVAGAELTEQVLRVVDILAVDLTPGSRDQARELVERCRGRQVRLLARGCETEADLAWAVGAGFELFLGRAAQAPAIAAGSSVAPSSLSQLRLALELLSEDLDMDRVEEILRSEPGLVVQVLNLASAGRPRGLRRPVRSVREAMVVMGTRRLQRWAAVTVLGRHGRVDTDALVTGLVRARTCELLAHVRGVDPAFAFTAGLLSTLDLVLGVELDEIEKLLGLDDDLAAAAFRRETRVGELVADVADYQLAVDAGLPLEGDLDGLSPAGASAFRWATALVNAMAGSPL